MNLTSGSNARVVEVKVRVEELRAKVRTQMEAVADAKIAYESQWPRRHHDRQTWDRAKKALVLLQNQLANAKLELTKLSGTTGHDPKWRLLREAWHILNEFEERGIEIGERAEALLDEIEFHVPHAALHAHEGLEPTQPSSTPTETKR